MHLKLTINGTAFTVATVRIVGNPSAKNIREGFPVKPSTEL
jgi:hypothetical protein